jgi:tetratricopeptide (TPR) repeat protein
MHTDSRGVAVSTQHRASIDAYDRAIELMHEYAGNPIAIIDEALARDPGFVLGHAFKAAFIAGGGDKAFEPELRASVEAAERLLSGANERERGLVAAGRAWLDGHLDHAIDLWGRVAIAYPRDTLAIQAAHIGDFMLGQQTMLRDRLAQVLHAWDEDVPGYGWLLGMYAFGLEETGEYAHAEEVGRRAVALNPRDGWASHAVAHVMEMQARLDEGIAWLRETSRAWAPDNALAYHNHWHRALYHLDLGEPAAALEIYDRQIRPGDSRVVLEMIDASALLWRLHLLGEDVGSRWTSLAAAWRDRTRDQYYAFNDVHALMAFIGAGDDEAVRELMEALETAARGSTTNARMTREVGLPFARALVAFARADYAACVDALLPVRHVSARFGGSNAQRDVLSLTLLEAALRGGQVALARALTSERTRLRPSNPRNWLVTARALEAGDDRAHAAQARRQALRLAEHFSGRAKQDTASRAAFRAPPLEPTA